MNEIIIARHDFEGEMYFSEQGRWEYIEHKETGISMWDDPEPSKPVQLEFDFE